MVIVQALIGAMLVFGAALMLGDVYSAAVSGEEGVGVCVLGFGVSVLIGAIGLSVLVAA